MLVVAGWVAWVALYVVDWIWFEGNFEFGLPFDLIGDNSSPFTDPAIEPLWGDVVVDWHKEPLGEYANCPSWTCCDVGELIPVVKKACPKNVSCKIF